MKKNIKFLILSLLTLILFGACKEEEHALGDMTAPTNIEINALIEGQDAANPTGDGSGVVHFTATADHAVSYQIGFVLVGNVTGETAFETMPGGKITKKFTTLGENVYRVTVKAFGKGGVTSVATTEITVKSVFEPAADIVTNLTANATKTWKVDKNSPGHFGVGPWSGDGSTTPSWWSAMPGEKEVCCNCFYTARFTFTQLGSTSFSMTVAAPDGAFTKTGALTNLPGIPASGTEGCYSQYSGGTSTFAFIGASSGLPTDLPSTQTSIVLDGVNTFIGYGSFQKEYEILVITENYMYLRVQGYGAESGNAWYLKLIPA